jgi:hypothetical protein
MGLFKEISSPLEERGTQEDQDSTGSPHNQFPSIYPPLPQEAIPPPYQPLIKKVEPPLFCHFRNIPQIVRETVSQNIILSSSKI